MPVRSTEWEGVYTDGPWLLTRNLVPGATVYGEGLVREKGREFRRWDANRSKLAAYLKRGGRVWPFHPRSSVLYLGAGSGTTVSHLSDVCADGTITAVEISHRSFRDLLALAEKRPNLVPILGDAGKPESYRGRLGSPDVLYQDVAQRDQEGIFLRNLDLLPSGAVGFLIIKSRSADVSASPVKVFESTKRALADAGFDPIDFRNLEPFQADHGAVVVMKP
ncbi:MAG TPA: fibrillarin-like rRNA/tRNA 2'-O-methyltransferase [Thermoplasmata archaeon]|nr:fibrillarin-like rRNA/tRNA 2'-O-methyltransferase [Thermoplasmata archaeon]